MKCFKRLVMVHISASLTDILDPLQFEHRENRSMEDVISLKLLSPPDHLENKNTCQDVIH